MQQAENMKTNFKNANDLERYTFQRKYNMKMILIKVKVRKIDNQELKIDTCESESVKDNT